MQGYFGEVDCKFTGCRGICRDNYCCRCDEIYEAKITSLDTLSIVKQFVPKKDLNTIKGYCQERVLRHCGVFDVDNWEPNIQDGYYGQECNGIELDNKVLSKVQKLFKTHFTIPKVLTLEYGHLLPILIKRKWEIVTVKRNNILIGHCDYYTTKLNPEVVDSYKEHTFPICVCIPELDSNGLVRLIDGYHRLAAFSHTKKPIKIILGEK